MKRDPWWKRAPNTRPCGGKFCVWRVSKTEKKQILRGLSYEQARDLASWHRDHCPDSEVAAGINYLAGGETGPTGGTRL